MGVVADHTAPVGVVGPPQAGGDSLQYYIPHELIPRAASVKAALYYQSIPPSYLLDRFRLLSDAPPGTRYPETERLLYMVLHLDVEALQVAGTDWRPQIASAIQRIGSVP